MKEKGKIVSKCGGEEGHNSSGWPCSPRGSKPVPTGMPTKQRWGHGRRHPQEEFISLLAHGCSFVLKKLG